MNRKDGRIRDGSEGVIGARMEVHSALGPGLLESVYHACFARELAAREVPFQTQRPVPVVYKGIVIECSYRLDFVVFDRIVVELKACDRILPVHQAQLITYLKLTGLPVGLLVNFNVPHLRAGLRRLTRDPPKSFRPSVLPVQSSLRRPLLK